MTNVFGASRYWVGGASGNWSNTSSWSDISGGASGASVPVATDDVFFDNSGSNANPTVTSLANIVVASIAFTNSDVIFTTTTTQTTTAGGVISGSPIITLSAANANIQIGQMVSISGTGAGAIPSSSKVTAISGTALTISGNATTTGTAVATLTFSYSITATNMTLDGCKVSFIDVVTVNNSLTFQGTDPRVILNQFTGGRNFTLGNGNAFTLTGNSSTNYFTIANASAYFSANTTSPLSVYFDPTTKTFGGLGVAKGNLILANNINTARLMVC